jgi:hypothetical protein
MKLSSHGDVCRQAEASRVLLFERPGLAVRVEIPTPSTNNEIDRNARFGRSGGRQP